ncbi:UNVERIFIED_CONTAM: hypothetical protein FKN15_042466 [Acipenser sinensis]
MRAVIGSQWSERSQGSTTVKINFKMNNSYFNVRVFDMQWCRKPELGVVVRSSILTGSGESAMLVREAFIDFPE